MDLCDRNRHETISEYVWVRIKGIVKWITQEMWGTFMSNKDFLASGVISWVETLVSGWRGLAYDM